MEMSWILKNFRDDIVLMNPRRPDWDSTWEQKITNPHFKEQVQWELSMLEQSDMAVFYLDPNTKSPITLMELGLFANNTKIIVCCPEGFWRKGNVDIVCERYGIELYETKETWIEAIKTNLQEDIALTKRHLNDWVGGW